jgi:hypothetical protein
VQTEGGPKTRKSAEKFKVFYKPSIPILTVSPRIRTLVSKSTMSTWSEQPSRNPAAGPSSLLTVAAGGRYNPVHS